MAKDLEDLADQLKGKFQGELLRPVDPGYSDARRIWNACVVRNPGLIARCNGVPDVQMAVRAASALASSQPCGAGGTAWRDSVRATAD